MNEDGSASFVNKPISVPGGESFDDWQEVPPGHYVAGKTPKLQQFALTPQELLARHSQDFAEDEAHVYPSDLITIQMKQATYIPKRFGEDHDPVFSMDF